MSLITRIRRVIVPAINCSNKQTNLRVDRVVNGLATVRVKFTRYKLMSRCKSTIYFRLLRGILSNKLTRVVKAKLRNRSMSASSEILGVPSGFRRLENCGFLTNVVYIRSNLSRILQGLAMVNWRLFNVLQ